MEIGNTALLSAIPWTFMILCSNSAGWAADNLISAKGWSVTRTRKGMQSVASLAPAVCLLTLAFLGQHHEGGESENTLWVIDKRPGTGRLDPAFCPCCPPAMLNSCP